MNPPGFNPMIWNCVLRGCHLYHRHYDIEHFAQCFPRGINFTDVDGFVELNGHVLIAEFKGRGVPLKDGQRRAFECLSALSDRITIIAIRCDYITGEIFELCVIRAGKTSEWRPCNFDQLVSYVTQWADRVQGKRAA